MTPKNQTLEGKNRTLGGDGGSKITEDHWTSFIYLVYLFFEVCLKYFFSKMPKIVFRITSTPLCKVEQKAKF